MKPKPKHQLVRFRAKRDYTLVTYEDYPHNPGVPQGFEAASDVEAIAEMKRRVGNCAKYFLRRSTVAGGLHYVYQHPLKG